MERGEIYQEMIKTILLSLAGVFIEKIICHTYKTHKAYKGNKIEGKEEKKECMR